MWVMLLKYQSSGLLSAHERGSAISFSALCRGSCCLVAKSCLTLCDPMDCSPPGSSVRGISQARIMRVGCHFPLQGIFPTQGSNPSLLHWQVDSLPLSHQGSPLVEVAAFKPKHVLAYLHSQAWWTGHSANERKVPGSLSHGLRCCTEQKSLSLYRHPCPVWGNVSLSTEMGAPEWVGHYKPNMAPGGPIQLAVSVAEVLTRAHSECISSLHGLSRAFASLLEWIERTLEARGQLCLSEDFSHPLLWPPSGISPHGNNAGGASPSIL